MHNHLTSTAATVRRCPKCRAQTFAGYSEGLLVHTDPTPLTTPGADLVAQPGRAVYVLAHRELVLRDDDHSRLAGLLLPEHVCGQSVPLEHRAVLPTMTNPMTTLEEN